MGIWAYAKKIWPRWVSPKRESKMVRNIQEINNPGGSNHFEQLVGMCLSLLTLNIFNINVQNVFKMIDA